MAVIPHGENLGFATPQAQRAVNVPAGAYGENIGRELSHAAGVELDRLQIEQRRQQAEERAAQKEAQAQRKAADRAKANATLLAAQDDLQSLHDDFAEQVKAGRMPKDKAQEEWTRQASERSAAVLEAVPEEYRELAGFQMEHKTAQLARGVRRAITARDQADTLAGINSTLESTQRLYLRDPKQADAITTQTLESLGPAAGLSTEQIRALGQKWRESTRFTLATSLVGAARRDNRALEAVAQRINGDDFADLDPQKKVTLLTQIEGFRTSNEQRAEAAARRAEAQAERHLREAEATFTAARGIIQEGKILDDQWVSVAAQKMAGTPFAEAFTSIVKGGRERAALGAQPVAVMDATLNQLRAQLNASGTNPKIEKQIKELEQVRDAARRDYKEDPLPAALERGVIDRIEPLDTSSMASVVSGLAQRVQQAEVVSTRVGGPVSPLLRAEAEQVSKLIGALPVEQRSSAVAELAQAAGPRLASAIGRQIAAKDKALGIALAMGGDKTTAGRYSSELVLRGAQAIKDKAVKEDNAALTGVRAQVAAQIGDAVTGDAREQLIDAAVLTYYGMGSEGSSDLGRAVRLATGGVTERGGKKALLPYGMTEDDFDRKLRAVTPQAVGEQVYIDGKPMPGADFVRQLPDAALVTVGNGRYNVRAGRSLATDKAGRPIVLEVR